MFFVEWDIQYKSLFAPYSVTPFRDQVNWIYLLQIFVYLPHSAGILIIQNWLELVNKIPRWPVFVAFAYLLPNATSEETSLFKLIYTLGIGIYLRCWELPLNGIPLKYVSSFWEGKKKQNSIILTKEKTWAITIVYLRSRGICIFFNLKNWSNFLVLF